VRVLIGVVLSFFIGAGCRYFDIPAASPPVLPGALIVLAMTLGYTSVDRILTEKGRVATTKPLCGGPTGARAATVKMPFEGISIRSKVGRSSSLPAQRRRF
jgi:XapX domain-containing protein